MLEVIFFFSLASRYNVSLFSSVLSGIYQCVMIVDSNVCGATQTSGGFFAGPSISECEDHFRHSNSPDNIVLSAKTTVQMAS